MKADIASRVYVLLSITDGHSEQAARMLQGIPGIKNADLLEGVPNLLVTVEAPDRMKLADLLMEALSGLDGITEDLRLLVASPT